MSARGPEISHLLFADDVLIFTKASPSQGRVLRDTLDEFCRCSGIQVNVLKSRFMTGPTVGIEGRNYEHHRYELGYGVKPLSWGSVADTAPLQKNL